MNKTLYIEIADTPYLQQEGLMFRKHLDTNAGMLFKFHNPQELKFWGLNTYLPLDIAFVDSNNTIVKIGKIKPMSLNTISSEVDCPIAIEANEGYFSSNDIKVGDTIKLSKDDSGFDIVRFEK